MTETTNEQAMTTEGEGEQDVGEMTEEGRYIPYGGGSMGWFENSGVMNSERGNNYLFHTLMNSDRVRARQFERWGQTFNRRTSRKRYRKETGLTMIVGKSEVHGQTKDISSHGVRIQFLEEVNAKKGDRCVLKLYEADNGPELVQVDAQIVWLEKMGKIRPIWNLGMTFLDLTGEQSLKIKLLLDED